MTVLTAAGFDAVNAVAAPFWRLAIDNWGNRGTGADATSLIYPNGSLINGSAAEIVIGPDSTVDRAVIGTTPPYLKTRATLPGLHVFSYDTDQLVSVDRPTVSAPGPLTVFASNINYYGDSYRRDYDTASYAFGGLEPLFEKPVLELDFYLRPPAAGYTPTKRNPMFRSFDPTVVVDAAEHLIGIWPVFGRKCMAVYFRATGDIEVVGRVGLISYSGDGSPIQLLPVEVTAGRVNVNAATGGAGSVATGQPAQYLAAYYTVVGGTSGIIEGHLLATDDACCGGILNSMPQNPFPGT